jgi:hypothetical protein
LVLILGLSNTVLGQLLIGVNKGDWIEYEVTYTGTPVGGHNIDWARMELLDVQGYNVSVEITSRYSNGSTDEMNYTLNLETGQLIDDFIIPANLKAGDTFYDQNFGNMTISKSEQQVYAGTSRTVLYAYTSENTYVWDQVTGVSVEGKDQSTNYSIHSIILDTNMWQSSRGMNMELYYVVATLVLTMIIFTVVAFYYKRKRIVKYKISRKLFNAH